MYFETHAGLLTGKITIIDNDKVVTRFNIYPNSNSELWDMFARYAAEYNIECIKTNNLAYATKSIEQKVNELLIKEYNYNKQIRMEYK